MERRKVIRQGKGTLTMSLPMDWVRHTGIKAGSGLDVETRGFQLIVGPSLEKRGARKVEIDLEPYGEGLVNPILYNLYIQGVDEIKFRFIDPKISARLNERVHDLLGFEIIEQCSKSCVVKALAQGQTEDFDMILRRAFLVLLSLAEDGQEAFVCGKYENLHAIAHRERSFDTLLRYYARSLNKTGGGDVGRAMHLYCLINLLEQLGDTYARYYDHIQNLKPLTISINKEACALLREFYMLFFGFCPSKARSLREHRHLIKERIVGALEKSRAKDDLLALSYLHTIVDLILDIEKFQLAMQVGK